MGNRFFGAYGLWHCGEGFQTILLMWYMAFHAGLSASEIGFYQALQLVPFLVFTAAGGSLTDRLGAKVTFAASTGLFAVTLVFYGLIEPVMGFSPLLFGGYCLLSGLVSAISNPAIDTFIPDATPHGAGENALIAATVHNGAKLSGNAATLLLPVLSAMGGFVVNGALMAASALVLWHHPRPAPVARLPKTSPAFRRIPAHFRQFPESFDILLGSVMLGLFVIPGFYIFKPVVLRANFPEQVDLLGLTGVVGWIGAILASGVAARMAPNILHPGRIGLAVWAATALLFLSFIWVQSFQVLMVVFFLLGGQSVGKALIYGHFLRDAPEADRGLLIGIDQTAFWGLATLGTVVLGWLVDRVGLEAAIAMNSGAILLSVAVLALRGRLGRLGRA